MLLASPSRFLSFVDKRYSQHLESSFTLGSVGLLTNGATSYWYHSNVTFVPMVLQVFLKDRCIILLLLRVPYVDSNRLPRPMKLEHSLDTSILENHPPFPCVSCLSGPKRPFQLQTYVAFLTRSQIQTINHLLAFILFEYANRMISCLILASN